MFFPSPSNWKMVKHAPNHVTMKNIGLAQTSREILEDGDVPNIPGGFNYSVLPTVNCDRTSITLSTLYAEFNKICIWPYVQCQCVTPPPMFRGIWTSRGYHMYIILTILKVTNVSFLGPLSWSALFLLKVQPLWRKYFVIKLHVHRQYELMSNVYVFI